MLEGCEKGKMLEIVIRERETDRQIERDRGIYRETDREGERVVTTLGELAKNLQIQVFFFLAT